MSAVDRRFAVGDFVTRDGSDVHVVESIDDDDSAYDTFTVRCVKAPASGWIDVGETEFNLMRRYRKVEGYES